jgi:hypothetical protein
VLTIGQLAFLAVAVLEDLEMVEPLVLESLVRATREVREDRLVATVLLAVEVETLARIYLQARTIGEPPLLSAEQMEQVRHQFRTLLYGN